MTARDVYYVLYRYKWMITIISLVATVAAVVLWQLNPVYYSSEAKLLIKYVVDTKPLTETGADAQVTSMNTVNSGENILNAEIDMLTSLDVCGQVAKVIGPAKILAKGPGTNEMEAAFVIQKWLIPGREKNSDVIRVSYSHTDRDIVVPVLTQLISAYETKHDEVRRPKTGENLMSVIDQAKGKVTDVEKRLRDERTKTDIVSLDDSKKIVAMDIEKTENQLDSVETEIEVQSAIIRAMRKNLPTAAAAHPTNGPAALTNQEAEISPAIIAEYRKANTILTSLRAKESDMLSWTTTNNLQVQSVESAIATTEARCKQMEDKNPGLLEIKAVVSSPSGAMAPDPMIAYNKEMMTAEALAVRYQMLTNQLAAAKVKQARVVQEEGPLQDLQRESDRDRATLDYYQKRQGEADLDAILEPGNSQISLIEAPTPPRPVYSKTVKISVGVLIGGLILAFGLPFLIDIYLDQSLKRPSDIQSRLGVPFFVRMPKLNGKFKRALVTAGREVPLLPANGKAGREVPLLAANGGETPPPASAGPAPAASPLPSGNGHIAPWEQRHALRPFFETLRDRLMTYFEVINLTHKPKLVAVTSCGEGVGVTTTAAGLASALSETGEGNVLLVNMNVQDGEAHHFYRGKLTCGLEEALETDKRSASCIKENLFVAKDSDVNENVPRVLPKRFSHLVPKMRASDYDYIIFDMPVMSQISITPRLARYMDMVLLVVESEKTDREVAKRATDLLLESKTNVGVVLNKSRDHLPRRLHQDI